MVESRTEGLARLQQLHAARRAAEEQEAKFANGLVEQWIRDCMAAAQAADSPGEFDRAMRMNPLPPTMAQAIKRAIGGADDPDFLAYARSELEEGDYNFPFPVKVYRSNDHPGAFILTIPNNPLLNEQ